MKIACAPTICSLFWLFSAFVYKNPNSLLYACGTPCHDRYIFSIIIHEYTPKFKKLQKEYHTPNQSGSALKCVFVVNYKYFFFHASDNIRISRFSSVFRFG